MNFRQNYLITVEIPSASLFLKMLHNEVNQVFRRQQQEVMMLQTSSILPGTLDFFLKLCDLRETENLCCYYRGI